MPAPVRPTIRRIAAAANVTPMTVSLALRNQRGVSPSTAARIRKMADQMGYTPDPRISTLMAHLRSYRKTQIASTLAVLCPADPSTLSGYLKRMVDGVTTQSKRLGFYPLLTHLDTIPKSRSTVSRVLRARSIEGVLILPQLELTDLSDLLDWNLYATVSTSFSVTAPAFHQVVPDQFGNTLLACDRLRAQGLHRIGLLISTDQDNRTRHHFSAAVSWHGLSGHSVHVDPLILPHDDPARFSRWLKRVRPEVIITDSTLALDRMRQSQKLKLPPLVDMDTEGQPCLDVIGQIDQRPYDIGINAVNAVAAMLQRGEKGLPGLPLLTMVGGCWRARGTLASAKSRA